MTPDGKKAAVGQPRPWRRSPSTPTSSTSTRLAQPSAIGNGHNDVHQLFMTKPGRRWSLTVPGGMGTLRENGAEPEMGRRAASARARQEPRFTDDHLVLCAVRGGRTRSAAFKFVEFLLRPENRRGASSHCRRVKSAAKMPRFPPPSTSPGRRAAARSPVPVTDQASARSPISSAMPCSRCSPAERRTAEDDAAADQQAF